MIWGQWVPIKCIGRVILKLKPQGNDTLSPVSTAAALWAGPFGLSEPSVSGLEWGRVRCELLDLGSQFAGLRSSQ